MEVNGQNYEAGTLIKIAGDEYIINQVQKIYTEDLNGKSTEDTVDAFRWTDETKTKFIFAMGSFDALNIEWIAHPTPDSIASVTEFERIMDEGADIEEDEEDE